MHSRVRSRPAHLVIAPQLRRAERAHGHEQFIHRAEEAVVHALPRLGVGDAEIAEREVRERERRTGWELVPRDENEEVHAYRQELSLAFLGPGGLATPDDVEALESCQTGFNAKEFEWSDVSRGMQREPQRSDDEVQMRGFWRQWHAMIQGKPTAERTADPAIPFVSADAEARK